jgi:hypothetical protein
MADKPTWSKWSRVMPYAGAYKLSELLDNACAALGRVRHSTAKNRPIRMLDDLKSAQDPRVGNLRTLVRPRDRGRMASSP